MMRIQRQALVPFVVATLTVAAAGAQAADPAHDRHEAMEAVGGAQKAIAAIVKKDAPFDAALVKKHAGTIADNLKAAAKLFPAGSGGGGSRAKAEIWSDPADFEKWFKDSQAAAVALQSVQDEAALAPALQALGATCKSCHDKYRSAKK